MSKQILNTLILRAILALGEPSTIEILDHIERKSGRRYSIGQLWASILLLEERAQIQTRRVKGGPERGFRDKQICRLTGHGLAEIKDSTNAIH